MNEYVNKLNEVLTKLQSMKIDSTYTNVKTMAECIEILMDIGGKMLAEGQNGQQEQPKIEVLGGNGEPTGTKQE